MTRSSFLVHMFLLNLLHFGFSVLLLLVTIFPIIDGPKLQVKNLLSIHPEDEVPVKNFIIRQIPRYLLKKIIN